MAGVNAFLLPFYPRFTPAAAEKPPFLHTVPIKTRPEIAQKPPQHAPDASTGTNTAKEKPGRFTGISARSRRPGSEINLAQEKNTSKALSSPMVP